jgi:hypothetical protein
VDAVALSALALLILASAAPAPAAGQRARGEGDPPRVSLAAWSGFSMRDSPTGFRFADDLIELGGRLTLDLGRTLRPWVQADRFTRPELSCVEGFACNDAGTILRAGLTLPLTEDDTRPGVHPRLVAGAGVGWSAETEFAYLLGFGAAWSLHPRLAPVFEARWEQVPGFRNIAILAIGLRVGLF